MKIPLILGCCFVVIVIVGAFAFHAELLRREANADLIAAEDRALNRDIIRGQEAILKVTLSRETHALGDNGKLYSSNSQFSDNHAFSEALNAIAAADRGDTNALQLIWKAQDDLNTEMGKAYNPRYNP